MNDVSHDSKRKHSELSSESESDEESVLVKLDRLAADSSDSGSDFSVSISNSSFSCITCNTFLFYY